MRRDDTRREERRRKTTQTPGSTNQQSDPARYRDGARAQERESSGVEGSRTPAREEGERKETSEGPGHRI